MAQVLVTSFKKQNGKIDKMHKEKKESATPERAPKFTFARAFLSCFKRSQNPSFLTHVVKKHAFLRQKSRLLRGGNKLFLRLKTQNKMRLLRCCFFEVFKLFWGGFWERFLRIFDVFWVDC